MHDLAMGAAPEKPCMRHSFQQIAEYVHMKKVHQTSQDQTEVSEKLLVKICLLIFAWGQIGSSWALSQS